MYQPPIDSTSLKAYRGVEEPIALYVHIPFCLSKCNYCDFNTYEGIENLMPSFVDALCVEIELWGQRLRCPSVSSIFFGGGTPSYLPTDSIVRLLGGINSTMQVAPDAEITLEANPDDVNFEKADMWRCAGFNRISIGAQSFDDTILRSLSRRHNVDDTFRALDAVRCVGFNNVSIDLMFGLPNQTLAVWEETLDRAVTLDTDHLSLYDLQIEPGTPLHRDVQTGMMPTPDDDLAADMYEMAMMQLEDARYEHYEISNWARDGNRSEHNLIYWRNKSYLGLGPGAHSSMMGTRFSNMKSPRGYIHSVSAAYGVAESDHLSISPGDLAIDFVETISRSMAMSETMMLGLRLSEGVSKSDFEGRFDVPIDTVYGPEISALSVSELIVERGDSIRLTRRGKLLGNNVFEQFIIDE